MGAAFGLDAGRAVGGVLAGNHPHRNRSGAGPFIREADADGMFLNRHRAGTRFRCRKVGAHDTSTRIGAGSGRTRRGACLKNGVYPESVRDCNECFEPVSAPNDCTIVRHGRGRALHQVPTEFRKGRPLVRVKTESNHVPNSVSWIFQWLTQVQAVFHRDRCCIWHSALCH